MTLRVSVVVDGNASSAGQALDATAAGIERVSAETRDATRATQQLEVVEQSAAIAARGRAQAQEAAARSARLLAFEQRNLVFQLNDVVVSLASGMNPMMVLLQQGSQISQMQGGLVRAFAEMGKMAASAAAKFWPVGIAAAAVGTAIAAMTTEVNKNQKVHVNAAQVVQAAWQLAARAIVSEFKPVTDFFAGLWTNWIAPNISNTVNGMIQTFVLGYRDVKTEWSYLPAALGDAAIQAAQSVLNAVSDMASKSRAELVRNLALTGAALGPLFGGAFTGAATGLAGLPSFKVPELPNPFAGAEEKLGSELAKNRVDVLSTDYVGKIGAQARAIALASAEGDKGAGKLANTLRGPLTDGIDQLTAKTSAFAEAATSAFNNMGTSLIDAWRQGGDVGLNVLNALIDRVGQFGENLINSGLNQLLDAGVSSITSALFPTVTGGKWGNGFWGSAIPGFATGGSFQVGGVGGTDSQLVQFRASPNERVTITKPGQGFGGFTFAPVTTIDARGSAMTEAQFQRILDQRDARLVGQLPSILAEQQRRGQI